MFSVLMLLMIFKENKFIWWTAEPKLWIRRHK